MDTLSIAKKLLATGLKQEQAEVIATTITEVVDKRNAELLTEANLKTEVKALELRLEKRFVRLEFFIAIMLAILVIPVLKDLL